MEDNSTIYNNEVNNDKLDTESKIKTNTKKKKKKFDIEELKKGYPLYISYPKSYYVCLDEIDEISKTNEIKKLLSYNNSFLKIKKNKHKFIFNLMLFILSTLIGPMVWIAVLFLVIYITLILNHNNKRSAFLDYGIAVIFLWIYRLFSLCIWQLSWLKKFNPSKYKESCPYISKSPFTMASSSFMSILLWYSCNLFYKNFKIDITNDNKFKPIDKSEDFKNYICSTWTFYQQSLDSIPFINCDKNDFKAKCTYVENIGDKDQLYVRKGFERKLNFLDNLYFLFLLKQWTLLIPHVCIYGTIAWYIYPLLIK